MNSGNSLLVDAAMILALILIGVIGYKFSPLLLPKTDVTIQPDPGCDLQRGDCTAALPQGGRLRFSITPRPIPVTTPMAVNVEITGVPADRVAVDFAGVDMSMGFNRHVLPATGSGQFTGEAVLPVCVSGRMLWQATLLVESGRTRIAVPFRFAAGH